MVCSLLIAGLLSAARAVAAPGAVIEVPASSAPVKKGRIAIPPMDVGLGVLGRAGVRTSPAFQLGIEFVRADRWSLRAGVRAAGRAEIPAISEPGRRFFGGGIARQMVQTSFDLAPRFELVRGVNLEAVLGWSWRSYRQQWTRIDSHSVPVVGAGIQGDAKWCGIRLRWTADLLQTSLVAPDGEAQSLSPFEIDASVFFRFPGTRDPFGDVPTLHR